MTIECESCPPAPGSCLARRGEQRWLPTRPVAAHHSCSERWILRPNSAALYPTWRGTACLPLEYPATAPPPGGLLSYGRCVDRSSIPRRSAVDLDSIRPHWNGCGSGLAGRLAEFAGQIGHRPSHAGMRWVLEVVVSVVCGPAAVRGGNPKWDLGVARAQKTAQKDNCPLIEVKGRLWFDGTTPPKTAAQIRTSKPQDL